MSKMDEVILVVERDLLFGENEAFQGVLTDEETLATYALNIDAFNISMRRGDAEENPVYKQPIPYVVVKRAGSEDVFVYKRLSGGGETRLVDKMSIGVGGHMNPEDDVAFGTLLLSNLERELFEELDITTEYIEVGILGMINDDSDDVGKVHLGIALVAVLDADAKVSVRETDQLEGEWVSLEDLNSPEYFDKLENWSKILVQANALRVLV